MRNQVLKWTLGKADRTKIQTLMQWENPTWPKLNSEKSKQSNHRREACIDSEDSDDGYDSRY